MDTGNPGNAIGFGVRLLGVTLALHVRGIWGSYLCPLNLPNTPDTREEQLSLQHRATVGVRLVGNEHNNGPVGNATGTGSVSAVSSSRPPKLMLRCLHQQNVFLSQSHISLGNIPVQSKCSRLLFLNNISKNETIVFTWKPRPLDFGEVRVHLLP